MGAEPIPLWAGHIRGSSSVNPIRHEWFHSVSTVPTENRSRLNSPQEGLAALAKSPPNGKCGIQEIFAAEVIAQQQCGYILTVASPQREAAVPIVTHPPR
jgi:hypothetical protein